ncbi:uncharacterized protein E0L32_011613 [Thyridium curvatum]|uniref:Uncharacterized protein n=1 Tax=Thyridium curvatum TaxID=1093900 RepID=A0A507BP12_9PEZI|nr:uncharacterized protein E0L32_011613 [Thyridium curvatum]TPX18500.1 hypothetical protein E0L32_011613 [Thyridium curvatum]
MSFLPFVGLPLSGLSLELGDGYIPTNEMPKIIGRTFDNYQARQGFYMPDKLVLRWSSGSSAMLPGMGIIYTPEGVERDRYAGLSRLPNSLAMDTSLPEVFLGPQAEEPLVGRAWGMRAAYDCSVVTDVSEFAILNRRSQAKEDSPLNVISDRRQLRLGLSTGEEIHPILDRSSNLGSYAEMGLSFKHNKTAIPIYDGTEASSFDSAGLAKADIIEMALWQVRLEASDGDQVDFNEAAGPGIKGIGQAFVKAPDGSGLFVPNRTFFQMDNMNETKLLLEAIGLQSNHTDALEVFNSTFRITAAAAPIGVRCSSISTVGYAVLDTVRSAFHSFAGSPLPLPNESTEGAVPRLGVFAAKMLFGDGLSPGTSAAVRDALVARLLSAIGAPPPLAMSNSAQYGSFVQAGQLQSAAMTAYALDALELMYDTTYRFEQAQERPGLTGSEKGKVLTPGIVPPEIPAVFFGLWAVGSVALALAYGFRRRQSDALNGYSFFRLGVEKSGEVAEVFS